MAIGVKPGKQTINTTRVGEKKKIAVSILKLETIIRKKKQIYSYFLEFFFLENNSHVKLLLVPR